MPKNAKKIKKKAKKSQKGHGDSNPPREFEDEIYSEICSNYFWGIFYSSKLVKKTKKGQERAVFSSYLKAEI